MRLLVFRSEAMAFLAEADLVCERVAEAREQAEQVVALARAHQQRAWVASGLKLLGDIHTHEPTAVERAAEAYRQALALATELGMRPLIAHCHFGLGKLYRRTGKRRGWDPWTERPLPEVVHVAYPLASASARSSSRGGGRCT